jgi:hypothetical protein
VVAVNSEVLVWKNRNEGWVNDGGSCVLCDKSMRVTSEVLVHDCALCE